MPTLKELARSSMVEDMISLGRFWASKNIDRGNSANDAPFSDRGTLWSSDGPLPSLERIQDEGVVCVGLIALLFRSVGIPLPCVSKKNTCERVVDTDRSPESQFPVEGYGGADEWLFCFRRDVKRLDADAAYPKGTLLIRCYNTHDFGHISMLAENAPPGKLLCTPVIQTAGRPVGLDCVTAHEPVAVAHEYYMREPRDIPPQRQWWDKDGAFEVTFDGPYYTHTLTPECYIR